MSPVIKRDHHEELRNICEHYPLYPGKTISHQTARDCVTVGWAERNVNGDFIPTHDGLRQYAEDLAAGMWEARQ